MAVKIAIIGGGSVGLRIARHLKELEKVMNVAAVPVCMYKPPKHYKDEVKSRGKGAKRQRKLDRGW